MENFSLQFSGMFGIVFLFCVALFELLFMFSILSKISLRATKYFAVAFTPLLTATLLSLIFMAGCNNNPGNSSGGEDGITTPPDSVKEVLFKLGTKIDTLLVQRNGKQGIWVARTEHMGEIGIIFYNDGRMQRAEKVDNTYKWKVYEDKSPSTGQYNYISPYHYWGTFTPRNGQLRIWVSTYPIEYSDPNGKVLRQYQEIWQREKNACDNMVYRFWENVEFRLEWEKKWSNCLGAGVVLLENPLRWPSHFVNGVEQVSGTYYWATEFEITEKISGTDYNHWNIGTYAD